MYESTNKFATNVTNTADSVVDGFAQNFVDYVSILGLNPDRSTIDVLTERARDLLDYCGIDYGKTEVNENAVDMNGYGALCVEYLSGSSSKIKYKYNYCDYIILGVHDSLGRLQIRYYGNRKVISYSSDGSVWSEDNYTSVKYFTGATDNSYANYTFYGDIRYGDNSPATDLSTPTQNIIYTNDPSSLTDNQLIDLLDDLLLRLKLDFPDLSTVEGLLSSILTKLSTLDSDNDNAILSDIYVAIQSLKNDNHTESLQIISVLEEIRDNLTGSSSGSDESSDLTELTEILKDMKKSLNYLVGLETIDVTTDIIDLTNIEFTDFDNKFFDKYASLINTVINKFGYGPVNEMLKTCHSIIFNTSPPADLTINYNGVDYTILSTSMFENEDVKKSLNLVKTFLSIFILIGWLTVMRQRITSSN